jgi:hypothetical protein
VGTRPWPVCTSARGRGSSRAPSRDTSITSSTSASSRRSCGGSGMCALCVASVASSRPIGPRRVAGDRSAPSRHDTSPILYLDPSTDFSSRGLGPGGYVWYMDDFVNWLVSRAARAGHLRRGTRPHTASAARCWSERAGRGLPRPRALRWPRAPAVTQCTSFLARSRDERQRWTHER